MDEFAQFINYTFDRHPLATICISMAVGLMMVAISIGLTISS